MEHIDDHLKRLHLANTRRRYKELIEQAEKAQISYGEFLAGLVEAEIAHREETRFGQQIKRARFPFLRTIEEFDFNRQPKLRKTMMGSFLSLDFVTDGRSLIFKGLPGRGKTHLAVSIAYRGIQNGFTALFVTAATAIDELSDSFRKGGLSGKLRDFVAPDILVVDEVGYLTYGADAANMLFHIVNERYKKKKSMIFTTNKEITEWGRILHDEDLAHAILDRVLERGQYIKLEGASGRTPHVALDSKVMAEASRC